MHVYQMRSSNQSIVSATQQRLTTCMNALRDVSKVWLVAKMVHTLFESILGNKVLEERLQKAAGRRHAKNKQNGVSTAAGSTKAKETPPMPEVNVNDAQKRKFDEMELGYSNGPPAPQMSYERSRPQTPALVDSRDLPPHSQGHPQQLPQISTSSPPMRQSTEAFMGTSRANTRPGTPFNTYSYPGTPPDLFLHTRGSPKISEDLWQNYQPDQLFPPEANGLFPMQSPSQHMVDPALRGPPPQQTPQPYAPQNLQQHTPTQLQPPQPHGHQQQPMQMPDGNHQQLPPPAQMGGYHQDAQAWAQLHAMQGGQQRPDDQWSSTSSTGPIVPTTLNVGDWFEFFGIPNGDMSALNGGQGSVGGYG